MLTSETQNGGSFDPEFSRAASTVWVRADPEEARLESQGLLSYGSESLALLGSTALRASLGCLALSLFGFGLMLLVSQTGGIGLVLNHGGMTISFRLASQPDMAVLTSGHSVHLASG